jgi:large conductance mechanosensitive channel
MSILKEFKTFAMRGNVIDMSVGIVIGAAFGKIVSSIVNDIIMPPIGILVGGVDFKDLKLELKSAVVDAAGVVTSDAVTLNYGNFIQIVVDFIIVAFAIFVLVQGINRMKKKEDAAPVEPPAPTKEELLLTEIRDLLKK